MCFLGIFGDQRGQNTNIFLKVRGENGLKSGRLACLLACPLVAGGQALCGFRTCQTFGSGPLVVCSLFRPLSCFAPDVLGLNMPLFAILRGFLAGFPCWMWVCIACVLCVACVAFVCVNS